MEQKSAKPGIHGKNKTEPKRMRSNCEMCQYYDYDEEYDEYYCMMDLDEDEVYRFFASKQSRCPYYRQGDDYTLARRQ